MADEMANEFSVAQKLQGQFRFYVVSLIFTLLAVSVQTAKLGHSHFEDVIEIFGWVSLFLSGLAGLWYIELEPIIREQMAHESGFSRQLNDAKKAKLHGVTEIYVLDSGENQAIDTRIANLEESISKLRVSFKQLENKNYSRYDFARITFIVGLTLLLVSRSASAIASLFGYQLL
jgi:hypothetical protein